MLYRPLPTSAISEITGRNVAHGKRNAKQRAFLAADLVLGRVTLVDWTVKQAAEIVDVSLPYVYAAITESSAVGARRIILAGHRPLIDPKGPETLAEHFSRATDAERVEAARAIGVGEVWDAMVEPLLA